MKKYFQAPLPFQGQKRRWIKQLQEVAAKVPQGTIFVDVFGGSGIVSHTLKQARPDCRVVWNDYDNYSERLNNVAQTNAILLELRNVTKDCPKKLKIDEPWRSKVLDLLGRWDKRGYVDWLTISKSVMFTMHFMQSFEGIKGDTLYNNVVLGDYEVDGYLEGVETVRMDWRELVSLYRGRKDVVLVLDPPYMLTDMSGYKNDTYWGIEERLDVAMECEDMKFVYFTSERSGVERVLRWVGRFDGVSSPFTNAERRVVEARGKVLNYDDIMYYNVS